MEKTGIALYLEKKREEIKLTQRELDVKAGLPIGTVGQLESGKKLFSDSRISKLAIALGVPNAEFWNVSFPPVDPERKMVNDELDGLSPDELLEVVLYLRNKKKVRSIV